MQNLLELGQRIKQKRVELNLTQEELAKKVGYTSRSSINKIELGLVDLPQSKILSIAEALGVATTYLLFGSEETSSPVLHTLKKKRFPVLGNVACGTPIFASEERGVYIDADNEINADFCLIAKGDSMINARIFDGDTLFIKQQNVVENGEIAVIIIDDEATVKRVYYDRENNSVTLVAENPMYKPMRFYGLELEKIHIIGKVVFGQYNIKE